MANNRIYLTCSCGQRCYLGKRFGGGYYFHQEAQIETNLAAFYDAHEWCPGGLDHFTISYEDPPNYDHGQRWRTNAPPGP